MKSRNLLSGRNWRVLGLLTALAAVMLGNSQSLSSVQAQILPQPFPISEKTLDDLFADVARVSPVFGGMFLSSDEQTLQVYLTNTSPFHLEAVQRRIVAVFGANVIPPGGIRAVQGRYGFLQLKNWNDRMMGTIFSIPGVTFMDIDEAKNRLRIGIINRAVRARVVQQLTALGIPRDAVVIDVTSIMTVANTNTEPVFQPASFTTTQPVFQTTTLHNKIRPTEGGYQIIKHNGFGGACTLGFNAKRAGIAGFVTSSRWCTDLIWKLDNISFFQAGPYDVVGQEIIDPQGFQSAGFPCPKYQRCRYSHSVFVRYDPGVSSVGLIARTTALTTTATPIITVDPDTKFEISDMPSPSQQYLVGVSLNKVGRQTGWTNGKISSTCATWVFAPNNLLLCQFAVENLDIPIIAHDADLGAPVFRRTNFSSQGKDYVELYGMLWGVITGGRHFVFSPIGGVPFQQTGIQSPTDLGGLTYINCHLQNPSPC